MSIIDYINEFDRKNSKILAEGRVLPESIPFIKKFKHIRREENSSLCHHFRFDYGQ